MRIITKLALQNLSGKSAEKFLPYAVSCSDRPLGFLEKLHVLLKIPYHTRLKEKLYAIRYLPSINSYKIIFKKYRFNSRSKSYLFP